MGNAHHELKNSLVGGNPKQMVEEQVGKGAGQGCEKAPNHAVQKGVAIQARHEDQHQGQEVQEAGDQQHIPGGLITQAGDFGGHVNKMARHRIIAKRIQAVPQEGEAHGRPGRHRPGSRRTPAQEESAKQWHGHLGAMLDPLGPLIAAIEVFGRSIDQQSQRR